jgi:hypothetical protein
VFDFFLLLYQIYRQIEYDLVFYVNPYPLIYFRYDVENFKKFERENLEEKFQKKSEKAEARKIKIPKNLHDEKNNFEKGISRSRIRNRHMSMIKFGKFNKAIIWIKMDPCSAGFLLACPI